MNPNDKQSAKIGETSARRSSSRSGASTPAFTHTNDTLKSLLRQGHKDKMKVMDMLSRKLPNASTDNVWGMVRFIANLDLETAKEYFYNKKNLSEAKKHIKHGHGLAQQLRDRNFTACFEYYWGRINFLQGLFDRAFTHFAEAEPHSLDPKYAAYTKDAHAWLRMCMSGSDARENYRAEELRTYFRGNLDADAMRAMDVIPPHWALKRKRDVESWDLVLRPAPEQHKQDSSEASNKHKPKVWMVHDTDDIQPRNKVPATEEKKSFQEWEFAENPNSFENALKQCKFTFRCYPTGVAPRTRPMTIFQHQRGEVIMPKEKWESLERTMKDRKVSMEWLAKEREARAVDYGLRMIKNKKLD